MVLQEFVEARNRGAHPVAVARHTLAAHALFTGAHTIVLIATGAKILVTARRVVLLLVLEVLFLLHEGARIFLIFLSGVRVRRQARLQARAVAAQILVI